MSKLNSRRRKNHIKKHLVVKHAVPVNSLNDNLVKFSPFELHEKLFPECKWTVDQRYKK